MPTATTTLPIVGSMNSGASGGAGVESLLDIEQVLFVDNSSSPTGTEDGTLQDPFQSIGTAITAAAALTPTSTNRILIFVWPGIYDEALTLATDYVYLKGLHRDSVIVQNSGTVLTVSARITSVSAMTFENITTAATVVSVTASGDVEIYCCTVQCLASDASRVIVAGGGAARFVDSRIVTPSSVTNAVFASGGVQLHSCIVEGFVIGAGASNVITLRNTKVRSAKNTGYTSAVQLYSTTSAEIDGCHIENLVGNAVGITAAGVELAVTDCTLVSSASSNTVDASVAVTAPATIENNVMIGGGISSNVTTTNSIKYVGSSGMRDWYATVEDALATAAASGDTIQLMEDSTSAFFAWPTVDCTIDGKGFTWTAAGISINTTDTARLKDMTLISSGTINVTSSAKLFLDRVDASSIVTLRADTAATVISLISLTRSRVVASSYAVDIRNANTVIHIEHSYLTSLGDAIYWNSGVTNNNVEIRHSTIWHGSGGANNPFGRNSTQTPNFKSHHSEYNSDPTSGGTWTNLVASAQRFDGYDTNTDY